MSAVVLGLSMSRSCVSFCCLIATCNFCGLSLFLIDCNFGPDQSVVTNLHSETCDSLLQFWPLFFSVFEQYSQIFAALVLGFGMDFCLWLWALVLGFGIDYLLFAV